MTDKFLINGGKPLKGEVEVRGAKNAAFPILAATLLTKEECEISNLPLIEDVFRMLEILKSIGSRVSWTGERTVKIKNSDIDASRLKEDLIKVFRGSVLFWGPLLARCGKLAFPQPGGCIIGARPVDVHLDGFGQLGVEISRKNNKYFLESGKEARQDKVILNEFSVTATENLLLFSALNPGRIEINISDGDYQVQELAKFLRKMGADIREKSGHRLVVDGKKKLKGVKHRLMYDPIEACTFIITAAAHKGDVLVKNVETSFLQLPLKKLRDSGVPLEMVSQKSVRVLPWKKLKINKIQSLPYPGVPSDLQSAFGVLATQSEGSTLIHDPLYEARLKYLEEVNKMGAEIYFADPHRAVVNGPTRLFGTELGSFDLRGGAALIIAALIAKGTSTIHNIYQVDRGYEKIEERLQKIGADIKRIN